jgi:hypothetical protein
VVEPQTSFDYAVLRVVPRVEREEFVNVGVIVYCKSLDYLAVKIEADPARLRNFWPFSEAELEALGAALAGIERIAAGDPAGGPIAALPQSERFHWITAPKSAMTQVSPVHSGLCDQPGQTLERLFDKIVRLPG